MKKKILTKKDLKFYHENGYLIVKNFLSKKETILAKKRLKKLEKIQKDGRGLSEPGLKKSLIHSLHKDKFFINLIEEKKKFSETVKEILNTDQIKCWNAKSNLKKKWNGSVEYFHQDFVYWNQLGFSTSNMTNCMIFLDDHRHKNGGLWIFPGSHKKFFKHVQFLNINSLQKYFIHPNLLDKISKKYKPISLNEKRGSCIFFHSRLIHGSAHNISNEDRNILLYDMASNKSFLKANYEKIISFNRNKRKMYEKRELQKRLSRL